MPSYLLVISQAYHKQAHDARAPYKKIYEHFNLTSYNVVKTAKKMLGK